MDGVGQLLYTLRVPIITSGSGIRMFSMFLFSGAVLSGFGLSTFIKDSRNHIRMRALLYFAGIVACFYVGGTVLVHWNTSLGVRFGNVKMEIAALVGLVVAGVAYIRYGKKIPFSNTLFIAAVLLFTFGDLFRMGYRFLTFSNMKFLYPDLPITQFVHKDISSSLGRVYGITEPEINTALGIAGIETYNPLFPLRTAKLLDVLQNRPAPKVIGNKYELAQNPRMKSVLDFLGVSLIVVPKGENPAIAIWHDSTTQKDITKVHEEAGGSDVYRNNTAYPRFDLYYDVRTNTPDSVALRLLSLQTVDFRKTVLIQEPLAMTFREGSGSARLVSAGLNTLEFKVNTSTTSMFYLSDSYDAGWHASVNGHATPMYHANYNFRGVLVPAGTSEIRFWYLPSSVIIGGIISIVGVAGTVGFLCFAFFWSKRNDDVHNRQQ